MSQNPSLHSINMMCLIIFFLNSFFQNSYYIAKQMDQQTNVEKKQQKETKN